MSDIGPGTWLECVDNGPTQYGEPTNLMVGALYCVSAIHTRACGRCKNCQPLILVGVGRPMYPCASRFRPIRDDEQKIERREVRRELV